MRKEQRRGGGNVNRKEDGDGLFKSMLLSKPSSHDCHPFPFVSWIFLFQQLHQLVSVLDFSSESHFVCFGQGHSKPFFCLNNEWRKLNGKRNSEGEKEEGGNKRGERRRWVGEWIGVGKEPVGFLIFVR